MVNLVLLGLEAMEEHNAKRLIMVGVCRKRLRGEEVTREDMMKYYLAKARYNLIPFVGRVEPARSYKRGMGSFWFLEKNFGDEMKKSGVDDLRSYSVEHGGR